MVILDITIEDNRKVIVIRRMQKEKGSLIVGLCDDEWHVHDVVEEMLKCYEREYYIDIQLVHYDSAKQLLEKKVDIIKVL